PGCLPYQGVLGQPPPRLDVQDAPLPNDRDPIAHCQQFGVIRTDQDDAQSAGGQRVDQPIDLEFRANIDALGWLVQDQEPGPGKEPAGDDNLLLVATRQEADALPFSGRVDAQFPELLPAEALLPVQAEQRTLQ